MLEYKLVNIHIKTTKKLWINNNVCPEGTVKCEDRPDRKGEKIEKIRKKYKCISHFIYGGAGGGLFLQGHGQPGRIH